MENSKSYLKKLSRRNFLRNSVIAAAGATLIPAVLTSCDDDFVEGPFVAEGEAGTYGFLQGVASFDPSQDGVILWSRYTPASNETFIEPIIVDVATDASFTSVVASQSVHIDVSSDLTVIVDLSNLNSNTKYYYRFRNERSGAVSVTGETRTLPAVGEASEIKLAVVSCANYQVGLFNTYGAVAESDADVVIHLGDYIYEYEIGGYGTNDLTTSLSRQHDPAGEIVSLDEYRTRYRQYRSDEQLQKAHQLKPFICVWDDHEVTNDAYKDGAENHQADEGDFETRKLAAIQAWHEYLPARVSDNSEIYRSFDFAGIVKLMMLDTRIVGRDKQLDYLNYFTPTGLDAAAFAADWQNPTRTLLGTKQLSWLTTELASSTANWNVLGTQVLMGKYMIPAELLIITAQIAAVGLTPELLTQYNALVTELATIKTRILLGDPTVTAEERARVETVLPYNLDAWDGYPVEREAVYAAANGKKLIAVAGDTHNAWHSNLTDISKAKVGAEFATASVSSPGFEALFGTDPTVLAGFEQANNLLIDDLQYSNASKRGFLLVSFTASAASADWRFIETLATVNTTTSSGNTVVEN
ncbi:MAG: alkaline phosphatase D family protein [Flammeovirgaceae bacterium]